ncbi:MAG: esterase family protein [Clostridiales bacterium]|nr:esterase family protein [Clostridiales bacterium]
MIEKRGFLYSPKGKNRTLHIYLPRGYDSSGERYPVMYFFDGHNLYRDQDATYGKSWGLETFLDRWSKDMIVVGMECSHEGNARLDEYSPYTFPMGHWGMVHGMGNQTMDWIVNEVKPMIDREYRTYSFREATGIAGSSMGGLMSLYAAAAYNEVFSKAACLSSAITPCFADMGWEILAHRLDADTRVYLSWGTEEAGGTHRKPTEDLKTHTARCNLAIRALLEQQNVSVKTFCQRGGHHCEADWEKQVPVFMDYLWLDGE